MSDDGDYSDDDGHIGGDMDPVMESTLSVDVGSSLTVRLRSASLPFCCQQSRLPSPRLTNLTNSYLPHQHQNNRAMTGQISITPTS